MWPKKGALAHFGVFFCGLRLGWCRLVGSVLTLSDIYLRKWKGKDGAAAKESALVAGSDLWLKQHLAEGGGLGTEQSGRALLLKRSAD